MGICSRNKERVKGSKSKGVNEAVQNYNNAVPTFRNWQIKFTKTEFEVREPELQNYSEDCASYDSEGSVEEELDDNLDRVQKMQKKNDAKFLEKIKGEPRDLFGEMGNGCEIVSYGTAVFESIFW